MYLHLYLYQYLHLHLYLYLYLYIIVCTSISISLISVVLLNVAILGFLDPSVALSTQEVAPFRAGPGRTGLDHRRPHSGRSADLGRIDTTTSIANSLSLSLSLSIYMYIITLVYIHVCICIYICRVVPDSLFLYIVGSFERGLAL